MGVSFPLTAKHRVGLFIVVGMTFVSVVDHWVLFIVGLVGLVLLLDPLQLVIEVNYWSERFLDEHERIRECLK